MEKFYHGCVLKLTREDTISDIRRNLKMIAQSGMNTVVVWPAWFWWEEKTADYPFATGKQILKIAEEYGLSIVMELAGQLTSMEYAPDFMMKEEYYPVNADGDREFGQNSFGFLNYFHPEVQQLVLTQFSNAVNAYKEYSALLGYDIFNETMYRSFDPYTMQEFRCWLQERYGTLAELNRVWERTYSDWQQVGVESWLWMSIMPQADYYAFRKAAVGRFLRKWRDAVKEIDPNHLVLADNIHSMVMPDGFYNRPQDDFDLRNCCDVIGMSFYPKTNKGCFSQPLRWEIFDAYYAASRREGYWISEMQTHIQALFNPKTCVKPEELRFWCVEAYAAGARSMIYWMWRPFNKGLQTLGRGLVNYAGMPTKRLEIVKELATTFDRLGALKPVASKIAIVFEPLSDDFAHVFAGAYGLDKSIYTRSLYNAYAAFLQCGVRCDITTFDRLDGYQAVVLSNQLVMTQTMADQLRQFVAAGGTLILDGRCGMMGEDSLCHSSLPGGPINDMIGVAFLDFDNEDASFCCGQRITGALGREVVEPQTATVLQEFRDSAPALTANHYGKGIVLKFHSAVWYDSENTPAKYLCDRFALQQYSTDMDVNIRLSQSEMADILFIFNETDSEQKGFVDYRGKHHIRIPAHDVVLLELPFA